MSEVKNVFIDPDEPVTQIESFCPSCEGQGMTRLLLCRIPFFKDIVVMSFSCDNCGYKNSDIQNAGSLSEKGIKITLKVLNQNLLNREVVKSEWAEIKIPELEFEIPANTQKGSFSTIEGILRKSHDELKLLQPERHVADPVVAQKIDDFLEKIKELLRGKSFTFELDDPSGNSFVAHDISKYNLPVNDPDIKIEHYNRTREQMIMMGYMSEDQENNSEPVEEVKISAQSRDFSQPLEESKHVNEEPIELIPEKNSTED